MEPLRVGTVNMQQLLGVHNYAINMEVLTLASEHSINILGIQEVPRSDQLQNFKNEAERYGYTLLTAAPPNLCAVLFRQDFLYVDAHKIQQINYDNRGHGAFIIPFKTQKYEFPLMIVHQHSSFRFIQRKEKLPEILKEDMHIIGDFNPLFPHEPALLQQIASSFQRTIINSGHEYPVENFELWKHSPRIARAAKTLFHQHLGIFKFSFGLDMLIPKQGWKVENHVALHLNHSDHPLFYANFTEESPAEICQTI